MRLGKKHTLPESLQGEREKGGGWVKLKQRDREIYEPVSQHYNVTTSWTIINIANEHSGVMLQQRTSSLKATVGECYYSFHSTDIIC